MQLETALCLLLICVFSLSVFRALSLFVGCGRLRPVAAGRTHLITNFQTEPSGSTPPPRHWDLKKGGGAVRRLVISVCYA